MDKYTNFDWDGLMTKLPVAKTPEDKKKRKDLFSSIDMNGNGFVSLAEMETKPFKMFYVFQRSLSISDLS